MRPFTTTSKSTVFGFVTVLLILFSIDSANAQQLTDVGDFEGGASFATGINNSGQVVGYSTTSNGDNNAFLYSNGALTDLGTLGGNNTVALGINNEGQVVGDSVTNGGNAHAFFYSNGKISDLGTLGGSFSLAYGINDSGTVVGYSGTNGGSTNAFVYSNGTMSNLGTLGGSFSAAYGINNSGQVVGYSNTRLGNTYAFVYSGNTMASLGAPLNSISEAYGINDSGQVAGLILQKPGGPTHAFFYSAGKMNDLGTLGGNSSSASSINKSGEIVGTSNYLGNNNGANHAFLYSTDTGLKDLNTLYASLLVSGTDTQSGFVSLISADSINDQGQIVGEGAYWPGSGNSYINEAFLVTPAAVPEPSAWTLGVLGVVAFWLARTRRFLPLT